jgi:hypothetical protein
LHDLRHGAATLTLATGADLKIVQDLLGHSSITITADTYAHVLPELARDTAEAAARIVPRTRRATRNSTENGITDSDRQRGLMGPHAGHHHRSLSTGHDHVEQL